MLSKFRSYLGWRGACKIIKVPQKGGIETLTHTYIHVHNLIYNTLLLRFLI
jgi:hypothetical protein